MADPFAEAVAQLRGHIVATFGRRAVVTVAPGGGAAVEIPAVFSAPPDDGLDMIQPAPSIRAQAEDVAGLADGDAVTVDGVAYLARARRMTSLGMMRVELELNE